MFTLFFYFVNLRARKNTLRLFTFFFRWFVLTRCNVYILKWHFHKYLSNLRGEFERKSEKGGFLRVNLFIQLRGRCQKEKKKEDDLDGLSELGERLSLLPVSRCVFHPWPCCFLLLCDRGSTKRENLVEIIPVLLFLHYRVIPHRLTPSVISLEKGALVSARNERISVAKYFGRDFILVGDAKLTRLHFKCRSKHAIFYTSKHPMTYTLKFSLFLTQDFQSSSWAASLKYALCIDDGSSFKISYIAHARAMKYFPRSFNISRKQVYFFFFFFISR